MGLPRVVEPTPLSLIVFAHFLEIQRGDCRTPSLSSSSACAARWARNTVTTVGPRAITLARLFFGVLMATALLVCSTLSTTVNLPASRSTHFQLIGESKGERPKEVRPPGRCFFLRTAT